MFQQEMLLSKEWGKIHIEQFQTFQQIFQFLNGYIVEATSIT